MNLNHLLCGFLLIMRKVPSGFPTKAAAREVTPLDVRRHAPVPPAQPGCGVAATLTRTVVPLVPRLVFPSAGQDYDALREWDGAGSAETVFDGRVGREFSRHHRLEQFGPGRGSSADTRCIVCADRAANSPAAA